MSEDVLILEKRNGILCGRMNRPQVLNALDTRLRRELNRFWLEVRDDKSIRVAIITGSEKSFSTGRDLKETADVEGQGARVEYEATGEWGYPGNFALGKPVIAAISGHCLAAGLKIAIGCDIRICSESARFGNPQVKRGRGTEMPYRLAQAGLPRSVVMQMVMTGEPLNAEQALRWGLVSEILPQDRLIERAWQLAEKVAGNSPLVLSGIKRAAEAGLLDMSPNDAMKLWASTTGMMGHSSEESEGTIAFAQKRTAKF